MMKGTNTLLTGLLAFATVIASSVFRADANTIPVPKGIHYIEVGYVTGRINIDPSFFRLEPPGSCSDIQVEAGVRVDNGTPGSLGSFNGQTKTIASVAATGNISNGYCEYTLIVPDNETFGIGGRYTGTEVAPTYTTFLEDSDAELQVNRGETVTRNLTLYAEILH